MESRNRKGWLAIFGCALGIFWSGTMAFGYPGVMRAYWQETLNVGAGGIGLVMTVNLISLGIFMFLTGKCHIRIGTRKCLIMGTVFTVIAMLLLNLAQNIYMVYVWAFVVNIGSSFIYLPGLATVQQWFPDRRGFVSGIINLVFGLSAAVMSPVLNFMMNNFGYINMNYILAAAIVVTNLLASTWAEVPDKSKLTAEERAAHDKILADLAEKAQVVINDLTVGQAIRTKSFWLIWLTWVFMGAAGISMITLSTSYAGALGLAGVAVLTAFNIANGVSRIIAGLLSDIIGGQKTGCFAFIIAAVGYFALPQVSGLLEIAIFAAFVGYGLGTMFAITPPLASGIFGLKYFGMIFGLIFTAYGFIAGIIGPALAGYVLQSTENNYTVVFTYLAVFSLLGALLIMLVRPIKSTAN